MTEVTHGTPDQNTGSENSSTTPDGAQLARKYDSEVINPYLGDQDTLTRDYMKGKISEEDFLEISRLNRDYALSHPEARTGDNTPEDAIVLPEEEEPASAESQHTRRGFLKWAIGGAAALAVGGIAYKKVTRPQATAAPAPTEPKPSTTATPSASAPASVGPTQASTPETNTQKLREQIEEQANETPDAFFDENKDDQMAFLGAALVAAGRFPGAFMLDGVKDDDQPYNNSPIGNESRPDAVADESNTDQEILNQYSYLMSMAYRGIKIDALADDYPDFTQTFDPDTAEKNLMLTHYYGSGSDFRNARATVTSSSNGASFDGHSTAVDETSTNEQNADREGNERISRRIRAIDNEGTSDEVRLTRQFFLVPGTLPNGKPFKAWIPFNV